MNFQARVMKVSGPNDYGFYDILFGEGSPIEKATTRDRDRADAAANARDANRPFLISTTDIDKPNPRGGVFHNHYFDTAEEIGPPPTSNGGSRFDPPDPLDMPNEFNRRTDPYDAWRMCLNKGGELAVRQVANPEAFETQRRIAYNWAAFFFFTPAPSEPPGSSSRSSAEGLAARGDVYEQPPAEEGIPFLWFDHYGIEPRQTWRA